MASYSYNQMKSVKPPPAFVSALHSVRKPLTRKSIAPLPPTPSRVYMVDPVNFRDVVQKLTGAPESHIRRLQVVVPPPFNISQPHRPMPVYHNLIRKPLLASLNPGTGLDEEEMARRSFDNTSAAVSPIGFDLLSPASVALCSYMVQSPQTIGPMEPNPVV